MKIDIMVFSKSFGYALRSILYVAFFEDQGRKIQAEEIAGQLAVPRHFEGKILKRLVKEKLLISTKGPYGGFSLHPQTLTTSILKVVEITEGLSAFQSCVLRIRECNLGNPCPMHGKMVEIKSELKKVLEKTIIADLLNNENEEFIKSIANVDIELLMHRNSNSCRFPVL
jgi:Rrf2 family protein